MIRPKKLPKDPNQRAHEIGRLLTEGARPDELVTERSERMAEIGSKGGKKGGKSRANSLTAKKRKQIAQRAADVRWAAKVNSAQSRWEREE
jgi:hypothetical protein